MKVLSIIGIVWFAICLLFVLTMMITDEYESSSGWGFLALIYALPYSIVILVLSAKQKKVSPRITASSIPTDDLLKLFDLKEKGVITEEEFNEQKDTLLKKD